MQADTGCDWSAAYGSFAGFSLATHGEQEQAVAQRRIPATVWSRTWAWDLVWVWVWLREAGADPIHLDGCEFSGTLSR